MKIKFNQILLAGILFSLCLFKVADAQVGEGGVSGEAIENFSASVFVNTDNSVEVIETIVYNPGGEERHGIYRDIYPYSSVGSKMKIGNISVVDEKGVPYIFTLSGSGSNFRIKIGDPDSTFADQKIYGNMFLEKTERSELAALAAEIL